MSGLRPGEVPPDEGRSWWLREALAADASEPAPPLEGQHEADVVILGGGYTGMWTAAQILELDPGRDVVLLEQDICGGGASGRNGGFVNGWWSYADDLEQLFGPDRAVALLRAGEDGVDEIGAWCDRNGVDAWFAQSGDMGVASSPAQEGRWRDVLDAAGRLGPPGRLVELTPEEVAGRCRSPRFGGGIFTARGAATVQPGRLARGLRRVLLDKGVRIHEQSAVRRFSPGPPAIAETNEGLVRAGTAVVALNAWAAHWKAFHSRITIRGSYIVLTEPAPELLKEIGWTGGEAIWDFRAAVHYLRTTPDGRIAFGTGGMQPGFARSIGPRFAYDERFVRLVAEDLWSFFPSFRDVPLEAAWGGPVDVSGSHVPSFGTLPPGNVHFGHGYTGNGVGPSHLGGKVLARLALGIDDETTRLPLVQFRSRRFPPEPIRSPGALVANSAILRKDATEDAGRRANPLVRFVAHLPRLLRYRLGP